jgi:pimeloyl-ACP methyl ester carboxylesterase/ketosteroid isomerase-like protein
MTDPPPLPPELLPEGVRARRIDGVNGLSMHILEAGFETTERPTLLLLHGFPEIAYSWRKIMPVLASAGFHVVAPDQRGYGRTTGWDANYDGDLASFQMFNLVTDTLALLAALQRPSVAAVIGHDFGASVAAWCALLRPDVFRSLVLMSAPFAGPPALTPPPAPDPVHAALAALGRPRKHYQWYYSTREANENMWHCPQGVGAFLRAYFHYKSADWPGNTPFRLASWSADELAKMPTYYIMDAALGMAETAAAEMPSPEQIAACRWLTEAELLVYAGEYERGGFQGGLQWYRCRTEGVGLAAMRAFAGRRVDVPTLFIAGASDWGIHQSPGALERMQGTGCADLRGPHLIDGAGHWVQQERPDEVNRLLLDFLAATQAEHSDTGTKIGATHDTRQDPSMTTSPETQADLEVLHALNHDYIAAVQHGDVRRFDELLAEEFYCSNPDGTLINRPGFLAQTALPVTIANLQAHDVLIRLYGGVAIIHARTTYTLPHGVHGGGRYTDVWARQHGGWRCISAHVTRL